MTQQHPNISLESQTRDGRQHPDEVFRLLVDSVRDYAIFLLDPNGRVATWNQGAERIKGYHAKEIIGEHFSRFYPREAIESKWPDRELEIASKEGRFTDEGLRVRKDGSTFWAYVVITALRDETGTLRGYSKVTRDLTERRDLEERTRGDGVLGRPNPKLTKKGFVRWQGRAQVRGMYPSPKRNTFGTGGSAKFAHHSAADTGVKGNRWPSVAGPDMRVEMETTEL